MSTEEMHLLGISPLHTDMDIEAVDPKFVLEGFLATRQKTWRVLHEIHQALKEGMTEDDARRLSLQIFSDHGVEKHWHKPYIRFGPGTTLTYHDPFQKEYRLQANDPLFIDLGPIWPDPETGISYEGDVGDSFVFGYHPKAAACGHAVRLLFEMGQKAWREKKLSGQQLYAFLKEKAHDMGYRLLEHVDGHRLGDFPHHKYTKERLASVQFHPKVNAWVLEIHIVDDAEKIGAFFEDLLMEKDRPHA